jgi:hypothetical protein
MTSESADPALSTDVISFVIAGKTWKLVDPIHSTGLGAVKKKKMDGRMSLYGPRVWAQISFKIDQSIRRTFL